MDTDALEAMIARDRQEWAALTNLLDSRPAGPIHDPESPRWQARDVYNHMARWMDRSMEELNAALAGRPLEPLPGTDDEINARWQTQDSALTLDQARQGAQDSFDRRIVAIMDVPADAWAWPLEKIAAADGADHYASHREYIEAAV